MGIVKRDELGEFPFEDLIVFYHQEFVKTLKALGYMKSVPSLLDLNVELLRHAAVSMMLSIFFVPFAFVDWQKTSAEDLMANGTEKSRNMKKNLFEHPICKKLLQKEMKSWVHKGWL